MYWFSDTHKENNSAASEFNERASVRPTLDDVERISRGQAANRRGTGSRSVPHRLNAEERTEWEVAKNRGYVQLRGTGWRRERGDSPLANSFRNYCDALAIPCIMIQKGLGMNDIIIDQVIVDFSTLRTTDIDDHKKKCIDIARNYSSVTEIQDRTNLKEIGGTDLEIVLTGLAIFDIPTVSVVLSFNVRKDSKVYAQELVNLYRYPQKK